MSEKPSDIKCSHNATTIVSEQSRRAWEIWKKLTDFSDDLWDAYEKDFMRLASSEPPPKKNGYENLPF
jgi:hypothetical protein